MAVVAPTVDTLVKGAAHLFTWTPLANGDTGAAVSSPLLGRMTVQVTGTFGAGGTVVLQGSNDGTNWETLNDKAPAAISLTAAGLVAVLETPVFIRPSVTAGDGTTALTVRLHAAAYR